MVTELLKPHCHLSGGHPVETLERVVIVSESTLVLVDSTTTRTATTIRSTNNTRCMYY